MIDKLKPKIKPRFIFTFQNSCDNIPVSTFTPSNNGGLQAFTVTGYTISDYLDHGDELWFSYNSTFYVYSVVDITGNQITMSFDYNAAITNVNTFLQFSIKTTANPFNFNSGRFQYERDKQNYFYRLKYDGKVKFKKEDYDYIRFALDDGCCSITMKTYKLCGGEYNLYYRSYIKKNEGTWNESQCTFECDMIPFDKYSCILANADVPKNLYDSPKQLAVYVVDDERDGFLQSPFYEYHVLASAPTAPGTAHVVGVGALWIEVNGYGGYAIDPDTGNAWVLLVREVRVITYIGDPINFVTPALSGYIFTSEIRADGKIIARYTKQVSLPEAPTSYDDIYGTGGDCEYTPIRVVAIYDPINDKCIRVSTTFPAGTITQSYNCRLLTQTLTTLLSSCGGLQERATSDFFEIYPIGDTPGYTAGINYVTGTYNYVDNIRISHISDVISSATGLATILNVSFRQMMHELNSVFNVYWFIDAQNRLRIEHESWFINTNIINVSGYNYNKALKEYTYIKEEIPRRERFTFQNAKNIDFVGTDIVYPDGCSDTYVKEVSASMVSTDIEYLANTDPLKLSSFGMVWFACKLGTNEVIYEIGALSGIPMQNAHLSWANLHQNYHTYGRVLEQGYMNYVLTNFITWKKHRKQTNQKYNECCLDIPETLGTVTTELGTGEATKITYDINTGTYSFELDI